MLLWITVTVVLAFRTSSALAGGSIDEIKASDHRQSAISQLVSDVCDKRVVLLGEDNHHGSGRTLEIKTEIVRRLINQCGFTGVLFESSFYEFVNFRHSVVKGTATPRALSDAIGALWAAADEARPLVQFLFHQSASGHIRIGGLDPQMGSSTGYYAQQQLADDLAEYLPQDKRRLCLTRFRRQDNWLYDDAHPFDASAKKGLRRCIESIRAALIGHQETMGAGEIAAMARAYERYLDMVEGDRNARDHAMFENFQWWIARWPRRTKVIVWSATVHIVKHGRHTKPMGAYVHEHYGRRAAAIGFSALAGEYGRPTSLPTKVSVAAPDSLEASAFGNSTSSLHYFDISSLRELGPVPGLAVNYARSLTLLWAHYLDGVLVLRKEHPLTSRKGSGLSDGD